MQAVILNGSDAPNDATDRAAAALEAKLFEEGLSARHYYLRDLSIGHCLGDFDCWVRTPGRCRIKDAGQDIERAVHDAAIVAFASPVSFGGYGPQLKKAVDRLIPLILPFFAKRADLTHHALRYAHLPAMIGVGVDAEGSALRTHLFSALVESNALNFGAPSWSSVVLSPDEAAWGAGLAFALKPGQTPGNASGSAQGAKDFLAAMIAAEPAASAFTSSPRTVILVASARAAGESSSLAIARYLAGQMEARGAGVEIVMAHAFARDAATADRAAQTLAEAEVLAVVAPLYVDALPYLALLALQKTKAWRGAGAGPQRVVGVINCGFPEPEQTRFAFGTLREFAREAGGVFAGGLPVGGGEMIHGRDLVAAGAPTLALRKAIDAAADSLCAGSVIPPTISRSTAKPFLPPFLYRFAGAMQWTFAARGEHLTHQDIRAAPFDHISDEAWSQEAASGAARARALRVVGKRQENGDAVTVLFEDPAHDPLVYRAGQFITLEAVIDGTKVRRAYSLASAPGEPGLAITVKRVAGGVMSNFVHDRLALGAIVRTHGPSGGLALRPGVRRLLLFAGGAGVVPLAAIARAALGDDPEIEIALIHGASSKARAIYAESLEALADVERDRFSLYWVFETPEPDGSGARGRMDEAGVGALLDGLNVATFDQALICGPDVMRESVKSLLAARGMPSDRVSEESFTSPRAAPASTQPAQATLVAEDGDTLSFTVAPGQTLLDAALDAGGAISFSCMSGSCGACRVSLIEGLDAVQLDAPNDVPEAALATGHVPACLCRLTGPVRFRVG
jgi:ferredoxin-NADP reductase/multimeric flavodoxin WrbA